MKRAFIDGAGTPPQPRLTADNFFEKNYVFYPRTAAEAGAILTHLQRFGAMCFSGDISLNDPAYWGEWQRLGILSCASDRKLFFSQLSVKLREKNSVFFATVHDLIPGYSRQLAGDDLLRDVFKRLTEKIDAQTERIEQLEKKIESLQARTPPRLNMPGGKNSV